MNSRLIRIAACAIALIAAGCSSGVADPKPALHVNHETLNLCRKPVGAVFSWQNLQLRNTGAGELTIFDIRLRGDANCAFRAFREPADNEAADQSYPIAAEEETVAGFTMTLLPGETRLVRIDYTPTAPGVVDSAAIVVRSDAASLSTAGGDPTTLVIPICGEGLDPDTAEGEGDAGADASAESCPDCGDPPAAGAAWCETSRRSSS